MAVELAERALVTGSFEPTGDRVTDLVLSACAGISVSDYAGEIEPVTRERAWCHAVLSGGDLPALEVSGADGYRLTHRIFYSTDFGRRHVVSQEAVDAVNAELQKEGNPEDLVFELGICLVALGQQCPEAIVAAAELHRGHMVDHLDIVANLLLKRIE